MFEDISGKTALVTGASGGLGLHFAGVLARHGAKVLLAARRADALERACAQIRDAGGSAEPVLLDVADARSIAVALAGRDIDILVNNAGISIAKRAMELDESDWDDVIDTNLKGSFLVAQAVARRMKDTARPGVILNIASILGLRVAGNLSVYAASKAASIQMTRSLALEWARHSIRVNALCPGYIETDLNRDFFASDDGQALIRRIPQRSLGQPQDLDGALLLLCSDAGRYITGATLAVDGGHLVSSL